MALEMKLPDIGEGLTEAEIVQWLVAVGDEVGANQPLVEVETAKAVVEISAPRRGVLLHQGAAAGATLEVGALLAVIGELGEAWAAAAAPSAAAAARAAVADEMRTAVGGAAPRRAEGPVKAVPLVRRLARDLGVDLATVTGTGPGGAITRDDVHAAAAAGPAQSDAGAAPAAGEAVALSTTRRTIARNLSRSWIEIPHVTVWGPADATRLLSARNRRGGPLEAYLVRAVLPVLAAFPDFNATYDGETLTRYTTVGMGVAIDTDAGLVVPVVKDAGGRSPADLAAEIERLIAGAQSRRLTPDDMVGGTFTVSNVGAVGGGYGTPIIPYGTTAILSVGRARDDVVVHNGGIHVAPLFPVALSFDHRIIDGASAARFLNTFVEALEAFAD
jgi:pyruvate dehydrogenase E2 component (dihydrolipoamide acetyltransferase)